MDRIISITLGVFIVILAGFTGIIAFNMYVDSTYRASFNSTWTYSATITTDAPLYNVTLFLPVPADAAGNSPVVAGFSRGTVAGIPAGWNATLFDTGKATLVKVTAPEIIPPEGTSPSNPYRIVLSAEIVQKTPAETRDPVAQGVMFRPVQALNATGCTQEPAGTGSRCYTYTTSLYADYDTSADATATITSAVSAKNSWNVFGPASNEYRAAIRVVLHGENHGWTVPDGELAAGIGSYAMSGNR